MKAWRAGLQYFIGDATTPYS